MSDWLQLDCPFCRTRFRIKSEYAHLKGRCPECRFRIPPPIPRENAPAPISDSEEPLGLVPLDELDEWPEPGLKYVEQDTSGSYAFADGPALPLPPAAPAMDSTPLGVYSLSEPRPPSVAGAAGSVPAAASAEDDDGGVYSFAPDPVAETAARSARTELGFEVGLTKAADAPPAPTMAAPAKPAPSGSSLAAPSKPAVDPLFLDELPTASASTPPPVAAAVATPIPVATVVPAAPVARFATDETTPGADEPPKKKKKKRPKEPTADGKKPEISSEPFRLSDAELNPFREEPLPDDIYFRGVWSLPFKGRGFGAFLWLAVGFTVWLMLAAIFANLAGESVFIGFARVGLIIAMTVFGFVIFTYAAEVLFCVIGDTAQGADDLAWPEGIFGLWLSSFVHWVWLEGLAVAAGIAFSSMTLGILAIYGFLIAECIAFSVVAISSLTNEWSFVPLNGKVLAGMGRKFRYWATYWLLGFLLGLAITLLITFALGTYVLVPVAGVALAYGWIVRARLLGRLGRVISEEPGAKRGKRKKRKRPSPSTPAEGWGGEPEETDDRTPATESVA